MITITCQENTQNYSKSDARTHASDLKLSNNEAVSGVVSAKIVPIPESFFRGLADCEAGRVVDMSKAMEEPPPADA